MHKRLFFRFVRWIGYDLGISPNQITLGRLIFFIPGWFTWVYKYDLGAATGLAWQIYGFVALVVVTIVIVFDIVDGALARETGQVSQEGKILDPIVDKFITYSTLALFWNEIHRVGFGILFVLDVASTFLRGVQVQGANQYGKWKALCQNLSKLFFGLAVLFAFRELNLIGNGLIWLAVLLASISVGIRILPPRLKGIIQKTIPQALTLSNLGAGVGTIFCAFGGRLDLGVLLNFSAMSFDLLDGAVARKLGVTSRFGTHFDTVADLVSFGVAPAVLVASLADWQPLYILLGAVYLTATAVRLYDYGKSKGKTPAGYFRGLPSPAAAWLVVSSVLTGIPLAALAAMVLAACLMCAFRFYWIHFSRVLPQLGLGELLAAAFCGALCGFFIRPAAFVAGPIIVYLFAPFWRKPASRQTIVQEAVTGE